MHYKWILFDADDTLFHFDAYSGLKNMFQSEFAIDFTPDHFQDYQKVNKQLWVAYQDGKVTAHQIKEQRFTYWAQQLDVSPHHLNSKFLLAMADLSQAIEGAQSLLDKLHGKVKIGIITNGFIDLQEIRLERTGFTKYFDALIISEQVGVAKPDIRIFQHTLAQIGNPTPQQVLMVGDNPDSDIVGGIQVGFDTCWLNMQNKEKPTHIEPKYIVSSLYELEQILTAI